MSVVRHSLRRLTAQGIASFTRPAVRHLSTITTSGKTHDVLLFKGDGIGPEITTAAVAVLNATGVRINWHEMDVGFEASKRTGHVITEEHLQAFDKYRVILKGPLTIPPAATNTYVHLRDRKFTSANQVFRKLFHLYANVRPAKTLPGIKTPFTNVDQVIIRENTEDVYTGEEKWVDKDTVEGIKRITRGASTRISKFAFEYAVTNQRKLVTAVHKANVCKQADGLFVSCATETAKFYPQIKFNTQLADSLLTRMVQAPEEFDVLLCPNLYGDLVSDLAAGLIGSLGLMPAGQFGDNHALFEPAHGSAPDIAGRGEANPVSMIRSAVMMLQHLGEHEAAKRVERAVCDIIAEGKHVTADLGGKSTTTQMTKAIIDRL